MGVPTYDQFIPTLFRVLVAHPDGLRTRDACERVADAFELSGDDRAQLLPSGLQSVYSNRIGWAHDRLKRAELSHSLRRGYWQLTGKGRAYAKTRDGGLDAATVSTTESVSRIAACASRSLMATTSTRLE